MISLFSPSPVSLENLGRGAERREGEGRWVSSEVYNLGEEEVGEVKGEVDGLLIYTLGRMRMEEKREYKDKKDVVEMEQ